MMTEGLALHGNELTEVSQIFLEAEGTQSW